MDACGTAHLELKCLLLENWVSELKPRAEDIAVKAGICLQLIHRGTPVSTLSAILTWKEHYKEFSLSWGLWWQLSILSKSYRNSARDIQHFKKHWIKGEPVIVRNTGFYSCFQLGANGYWRAFSKRNPNSGGHWLPGLAWGRDKYTPTFQRLFRRSKLLHLMAWDAQTEGLAAIYFIWGTFATPWCWIH